MWIKAAAAAAVLAAGGFLGGMYAKRLSDHRAALQDALLLLQLLQARVENGPALWLQEIVSAAQDAAFQVLRFPEKAEASASLRAAVQSYIADADVQKLLGEEGVLLCHALECAVTRGETAARLRYHIQLLQQRLDAAQRSEERDKKLFMRLGWLGGGLLAVILW